MAIKSITFAPGGINSFAFIGSSPVLSISLTASNTSPADLTVNSLSGAVVVNGQIVGNVSNFLPVTIPANSQAEIPVTIQFSIGGLANDLIRLFQTGSLSQQASLTGTVNIEGIQVPFDTDFLV